MPKMNVQEMPIGDIKPYERNPRKNAAAVDYVANSIKEFGFKQPIVVDADHVIVVGHTRWLAAKKLKLKTVPVLVADDLTPEQAKAYRLADNKTNEFAEWDDDLLDLEMDDLSDIDMSLFGFELDEDDAEPGEITEDEIPEEAEERCKPGDLWQLGNHRLICGDSTDPAIIEKLMDGQTAELLLTDPPYGISVVSGGVQSGQGTGHVGGGWSTPLQETGKIGGNNTLHFKDREGRGGSMSTPRNKRISPDAVVASKVYKQIIGDDTTETAEKSYEVTKGVTKNQIIFGGNYFTNFLSPSRCWIVWDKENTGNFADAELAWTSFDKGVKLYHFMWNGLAREGSRKVEGITRMHPTQKPVGMIGYILQDFSKEGDGILDCFGGSGSTLIACEQLKRKCFMAELDPHYCDVIIERWENFTGEKAILLAQGE